MSYPPPEDNWGTPPTQQPGPQRPVDPSAGADDRTIAVLAHLSPIIAAIVSAGWLSFVGPLVLWFVYKDRPGLVRSASATSFNFHITIWVCWLIGWIFAITLIGLPIALVLWIVPGILQLIFSILGALAAWKGEIYRYPFQIPILRS